MLIGGKKRVMYTIEVFEQDAPAIGRQFRDPRGRKWTVRGRRQALDIVLCNPPAPFPPWQLDIEAEHPAYAISAGEKLTPIFTLDEIRAARDAARLAHPQLEQVGVYGDNEALIFFAPKKFGTTLPTEFMGVPVVFHALEER